MGDTPSSTPAALPSHYGDWPNTQGFDVRHQELTPTDLEVVGEIPAYVAGVLFRNGLGPREVELSADGSASYKVSHWFDSFSQVHRFQIHPPTPDHPAVRVTHNSRLTSDGVIERLRRTGYMADFTFGAKRDPCLSLFQKVQSVFTPLVRSRPDLAPNAANVSVSLSPNFPGLSRTGERQETEEAAPASRGRRLVANLANKTDSATMQMLDPETLEPTGLVRQRSLHPSLTGPLSAAHACRDPDTGDVFNYNLDLGPDVWRVFTVSAATGRTSVLATIKHTGAYVHSLFLTERYVVLCVWNSFFFAGGTPMLWRRNFVDAFAEYNPGRPARWFVVDRRPGGKGLVASYDSEPFFAFHSINAYEEPSGGGGEGEVDIVADVYVYENLDIIKRFYIDNLMSDSPAAKAYFGASEKGPSTAENPIQRGALRRFRLAGVPPLPPLDKSSDRANRAQTPQPPAEAAKKATVEHRGTPGLGPELPSINGALAGRRHRFVYGVTFTGLSTFLDGLVKHDMDTGETLQWCRHGQTAGEPLFVADPERAGGDDAEDAGALLSVVLDGTRGKSYLLVLDAKTMREVGRANVDGVVGFGFHGVHVAA
ncbi:hypothetical protein RB594_007052 [Gaeumannomyces avenae]